MAKLITVIVNHHKTPDFLNDCLDSVKKYIRGIDYQLIVSDSEADLQARAIVERTAGAEYLAFEKNVGFSRSVNEAIKKSRGEFILILNADTLLCDADAISRMIARMEDNPDVGLLGPRLLNGDGSIQKSTFRFYSPALLLYRRTLLGQTRAGKRALADFLMEDAVNTKTPAKKDAAMPVGWIMGAAMLVRRSALDKVGLLDERFFMYFDDVDWCRRFWEAGFKVVYFPGATIKHRHLRESKKFGGIADLLTNKYTRIHLASALKYFLKYKFRKPPFR